MQAAALRREAMETIGYYVQWKTNEYLGMEWGDRDRRLYIGHLRQRAGGNHFSLRDRNSRWLARTQHKSQGQQDANDHQKRPAANGSHCSPPSVYRKAYQL